VINTTAARQLSRRGIPVTVLPNVMDFEEPLLPGDGAAYRAAAGLGPDDLALLQPTRVVPRKGIQTTLRLAAELADGHVRAVVSHREGDEGYAYGRPPAAPGGRAARGRPPVRPGADRLPTGARPAPAADAYAAADLVCYPHAV
jgi:hypothetical protein